MIKTFYAKEPGRYVQIERDVIFYPGVDHQLENAITGYKMVVDMDTMTYDSFITEECSPVWAQRKRGKAIDDVAAFWREVSEGHLVEKAAQEQP